MVRGDFWFRLLLITSLAACGSSGKKEEGANQGAQPAQSFFQLKVDVSGLEGDLVISSHNESEFAIQADGQFALPSSWNQHSTYEIRVKDEPCAQRCVVDEPQGQIQTTGSKTIKIACSPKTWEFPMAGDAGVSVPVKPAFGPQLKMNKYGDMLVNWYQNDYFTWQFYKAQYENRKWKKPTTITDHFTFSGIESGETASTLNDLNESSIMWTQVDGAGNRQLYVGDAEGSEWTFPASSTQTLNVNSESISDSSPVIRSNALGEKIAVWAQHAGGSVRLYKAEYRNGNWNFPTNIVDNINPDGTDVSRVDAAINDLGEIIIVWQQSDGNYESIYKSEYRNGIWEHPTNLNNDITMPGTDALEPRVAMNNVGDAFITWYQGDSASTPRYQVSVAEGHNGTWTVPSSITDNISPNGKHSKYPTVVVNDQRVAKIASMYRVDDSVNVYQIAIQEKNQGGPWSSPMILSTSNANSSPSRPQIGMDQQGNVLVAWSHQSNGNVFKAELRNGVWTFAELSNPVNFTPSTYDYPSVAVNNCRAAIAWQQQNAVGIEQVYVAQYH